MVTDALDASLSQSFEEKGMNNSDRGNVAQVSVGRKGLGGSKARNF